MCKIFTNGYEIENSKLVTKLLSEKFANEIKHYDLFSNAYISSRMILNGHPWVMELRRKAGNQVAYIILEGYNDQNKRNAYFYRGPMNFPCLDFSELSFSSGNYQGRITRNSENEPVVYWKKIE